MANHSLSRTKSFKPVGSHAIHVLARLAAKKAVQEELRAQGVRVTLVRPAEIAEKAKEYLDANPHLYKEALERARRMGWVEPRLETPMEWFKPPCLQNR
jgi:NAD(P)-dependent dehydrogenase (short-subunit alcohol dehydrogenase family)